VRDLPASLAARFGATPDVHGTIPLTKIGDQTINGQQWDVIGIETPDDLVTFRIADIPDEYTSPFADSYRHLYCVRCDHDIHLWGEIDIPQPCPRCRKPTAWTFNPPLSSSL
jgi:hypothetical protein